MMYNLEMDWTPVLVTTGGVVITCAIGALIAYAMGGVICGIFAGSIFAIPSVIIIWLSYRIQSIRIEQLEEQKQEMFDIRAT